MKLLQKDKELKHFESIQVTIDTLQIDKNKLQNLYDVKFIHLFILCSVFIFFFDFVFRAYGVDYFVRFEEVEGMTELNTLPPQPIKVTTPFAFEICDTSSFGEYSGNGLFFQVKQGAKLSFNSLSEILSMKKDELIPKYPNIPKLLQTDYGKDQYEQHLFYLALQEYISSNVIHHSIQQHPHFHHHHNQIIKQ